jgi:hypothetical protein
MAINNTNTVTTIAGVDLTSSYIRIEGKLRANGGYLIMFKFYKDKASHQAGDSDINKTLDDSLCASFETASLTSTQGYDYLHDLAIAELVARGMDNAKLTKVDLV